MPCEMGHPNLLDCPNFRATQTATEASVHTQLTEDISSTRLPWTGRALGLNDIVLASARSSANLVGVVGPFNAGKTGLLTALFSHLANSGSVEEFGFAGSFTLHGWQQLRKHTVWPSQTGPSFPPHTPDSGDRVPGLLHLAFRRGSEPIRDFLFTDAPGEWFTRWVSNQGADDAKGARWIADSATQLVFVVDRASLAGEDVGKSRHEILALARVVAEQRRNRPIIIAWTKSDLDIDTDAEAPVRERLREFFGDHRSLNLSVRDPQCMALLAHVLSYSAQCLPALGGTKRGGTSAFSNYRRSVDQ